MNQHVARLFDDLSRHVDELMGCPTGVDPGFLDRSMEAGTKWAPEVLAAVGTCHVFISLISSGYLKSKWCAMEWDAFSQRKVDRRSSVSSESETAILPVIWSPMQEEFPATVRELQLFRPRQLKDPGIAQSYLDEGVYGLLTLEEKAAYQAVAWRLAQQIVHSFHTYDVERRIPTDLQQLRKSFRSDGE